MSKPIVTENLKTYPGFNKNFVLPNGQKIKVIRVSDLSQKMQSQVSKVLTKPNILSKPVMKSALIKPVILNTAQKPIENESSKEVVTKSVQESSNNSGKEICAQTSIDLPEPIDLDDVDDIDEPTESFLKIDPNLSAGKVVQLSPKADPKFVKLLLNGNSGNVGNVKLIQSHNGQSQSGGKVMVLNGNNLNNIRFISSDNNKQVGGQKIMLVNQQSMVQSPKPTIAVKTDLCKPSTSSTTGKFQLDVIVNDFCLEFLYNHIMIRFFKVKFLKFFSQRIFMYALLQISFHAGSSIVRPIILAREIISGIFRPCRVESKYLELFSWTFSAFLYKFVSFPKAKLFCPYWCSGVEDWPRL